MRNLVSWLVVVFACQLIVSYVSNAQAAESAFSEPIITDEYAIFPVTTELQRSELGNGSIDVAVFVNGSAFRDVEKIDRFLPVFEKLQKQLQDLPKGDNAGVIFNCIDGHVPSEPSDAVGQRLEALTKTSEEVGYYAGYLNVKWSQMFRGGFNWQEFIDQARQRANSTDLRDESAVGNERIQVFPIRSILSGLMYNADCLVKVTQIVTGDSRYPKDLEGDLNEYLSHHSYAGHQTMLLSIKVHESGRGKVDQWNEDIEERTTFARRFGFEDCNVTSAYYDQRSMVISVINTDDRPIEGVQVRLNHIYRSRGSDKESLENRQSVTGKNGLAIINWSGESVDLRLWFYKAGYVSLFARWATDLQVDDREIPDVFEVKLTPGTEIGGIVVNDEGESIEGAMIDVYDGTAFVPVPFQSASGVRLVRSGWLTEGGIAPITDAEGHWSLNTVPSDRDLVFNNSVGHRAPSLPIQLRVRHPEYREFNAIDDPAATGSPTLQELRQKTAKVVLSKALADSQPVGAGNDPN